MNIYYLTNTKNVIIRVFVNVFPREILHQQNGPRYATLSASYSFKNFCACSML